MYIYSWIPIKSFIRRMILILCKKSNSLGSKSLIWGSYGTWFSFQNRQCRQEAVWSLREEHGQQKRESSLFVSGTAFRGLSAIGLHSFTVICARDRLYHGSSPSRLRKGSDSYSLIKKQSTPLGALFFGAGDRDRTGTLFTARDFKSLVSACSTTPAW